MRCIFTTRWMCGCMICMVHVACWLLYVAIATDARMQIGFMHYNTEEEVDRVLEQLERM